MKTLEDEVREVVSGFMNSNELFTALDVSNKVKMTMPLARHRDVRNLVRSLFTADIETAGWARTPIVVTLADGSTAEALLYHPVSDMWDLDSKYDAQKRAQGTVTTAPVVVPVPVVLPTPTPSVPQTPVVPAVTLASSQTKDRWMQLFNNAPSLFPIK